LNFYWYFITIELQMYSVRNC